MSRLLPEAFIELAPLDPDNPPRPKAAKLARGLPASFDTCCWIRKTDGRWRGKRGMKRGFQKRTNKREEKKRKKERFDRTKKGEI